MTPATTASRLRPEEWRELFYLMLDARYVHLQPLQERRLRELLSIEDAQAGQMAWDRLVKFGLFILGGHFLEKALADLRLPAPKA